MSKAQQIVSAMSPQFVAKNREAIDEALLDELVNGDEPVNQMAQAIETVGKWICLVLILMPVAKWVYA